MRNNFCIGGGGNLVSRISLGGGVDSPYVIMTFRQGGL